MGTIFHSLQIFSCRVCGLQYSSTAVTGMRAQGIIQVILLLSEGVDHRALQIAKDPVRYVSQIGFQ